MKKFAFFTAFVLALSLAMTGCGSTADSEQPEESTETVASAAEVASEKNEYAIGETWTVDGQWSLTITDVEEMSERNEYDDHTPAAVYLISYTYENIGYEDDSGIWDGLYLSMDVDGVIVDSAKKMGYTYPNTITNYPQETPIGATCDAQTCIGVDNAGSFQLQVSTYDGNDEKQSAVFHIEV